MKGADDSEAIYSMNISEINIEGVSYASYGITGRNVQMEDVSVDKCKVEEMIKRMNESGLEECHFREFIEDELVRR